MCGASLCLNPSLLYSLARSRPQAIEVGKHGCTDASDCVSGYCSKTNSFDPFGTCLAVSGGLCFAAAARRYCTPARPKFC